LREKLIYANHILNEIECEMEKHEDNNHWLGFKEPWLITRKERKKYQRVALKLMNYAIRSTFKLHHYQMLHLDIKGQLDLAML